MLVVVTCRILVSRFLALFGANLRSRYRNTVAGFVWVILSPIAFFGTQALVFGYLLGFQKEGYWTRLLLGLLPWIFLASSLEMSAGILVNQSRLIKSFPIQPLLLILAQVADNLLNIVFAFLILLAALAFLSGDLGLHVLLFPLAWIPLILFTGSMACFVSMANVFFRDVRYVLHFILQISFFLTPIFYSKDQLPSHVRPLLDWNPFALVLAPSQALGSLQFPFEIFSLWFHAMALSLVSLVATHFLWKRLKRDVALRI